MAVTELPSDTDLPLCAGGGGGDGLCWVKKYVAIPCAFSHILINNCVVPKRVQQVNNPFVLSLRI
ncbi:MAG TPA: hypothetical protein VFI02_05185, partial [Armatimonadota bacterium]|nr:hypothetical protein [Armatimonadota bacterium]